MKRIALVALVLLTVAVAAQAQSQCLLTTVTESLPNFPLNTPANFEIETVGGNGRVTFEVTGGVMPEGLHLNANGRITGVPRTAVDDVIFVTMTDATGCSLTQAYAIRVGQE